VPGFVAVNAGGTIFTSTTSVTASLNGCVSAPVNFTVRVDPKPNLTLIPDPAICAGQSFDLQTLFTPVNLADVNNINGIVSGTQQHAYQRPQPDCVSKHFGNTAFQYHLLLSQNQRSASFGSILFC
jgi:hypothetical protein